MNVFDLRNHLVTDYAKYIESFIQIRDTRIRTYVAQQIENGLLCLKPYCNSIQHLNPVIG